MSVLQCILIVTPLFNEFGIESWEEIQVIMVLLMHTQMKEAIINLVRAGLTINMYRMRHLFYILHINQQECWIAMNQAADAWFDNKLTLNLGGKNLKPPTPDTHFLTEEEQVGSPEPIPIPLPTRDRREAPVEVMSGKGETEELWSGSLVSPCELQAGTPRCCSWVRFQGSVIECLSQIYSALLRGRQAKNDTAFI